MPATVTTVEPRIKNLQDLVPGPFKAIQDFAQSIDRGAVAPGTLELVHLRASQINGCSFCVDMGCKSARKEGETDERLFAVAAWREAPYFTEAERAALDFTEALTRIADAPDPIPDELWARVASHFDDRGMMAIILMVAATNVFNRINVSIRQPAGSWG